MKTCPTSKHSDGRRTARPRRTHHTAVGRLGLPGGIFSLMAVAWPLQSFAGPLIQVSSSTAQLFGSNSYYVSANDLYSLTSMTSVPTVLDTAVAPGVVTSSGLAGSQQKEIDERPNGGGVYRIDQQHDTQLSQSYTLDTASPGVSVLSGWGLGRADYAWTLLDGFGQHLTGSQLLPSLGNYQSVRFDLLEAADVRLAGLTESSGTYLRSFMKFHRCPLGQVCEYITDFLVEEANTVDRSFEFEGHLEPGVYLVSAYTIYNGIRASATELNLFGSWNYTLEFSAATVPAPMPEPGSLSLAAGALLAMSRLRRRRA